MREATRPLPVTTPSLEDRVAENTDALRDLSAVIAAATAVFERAGQEQPEVMDRAEALMARAADIELVELRRGRELREYAGYALFYRAAGPQIDAEEAPARPRRTRRPAPRHAGGHLRPLSVVALVAAAGQPLRHAVVAHKIAAAAAVTAFAVPATAASIVLLPSSVPVPPPRLRHVAVQASTGPVDAAPVPQRDRYVPRHARPLRASPDGTGTPAPTSLPFPSLAPVPVPVPAPVPSPTPSVTASPGILDIQQVSVVLRPSPTDPTVLVGEIDFRAVGGPVEWSAVLDSPDSGLALSASSGTLEADGDGSVTVSMPVVQGMLPGSAEVEIGGQPVTVQWG